jgi:hypothetical protein
MGVTYYCPSCWCETGKTTVCPQCGAELEKLGSAGYAVDPLIEVTLSATDVYLQDAPVTRLGRIGGRCAGPCLASLSRARPVRVRLAAR